MPFCSISASTGINLTFHIAVQAFCLVGSQFSRQGFNQTQGHHRVRNRVGSDFFMGTSAMLFVFFPVPINSSMCVISTPRRTQARFSIPNCGNQG
jgi:hypothetical protein